MTVTERDEGAGGRGGPPPDAGLAARLDAWQRRHTWAGFPLAVGYKFFEDQGNFLAALITYYGFISLFFLLLLLVTILGFVAHGYPGIRTLLLHSALIHFPIVGNLISQKVHPIGGGVARLVVGLVVSVHGGLEVVQAAWNAFHRVWAVPRQDRLNPIQTRARSAALLLVLGGGVLMTTGLSALTTNAVAVIGFFGQAIGTLLSFALNVVIYLFAFRWLSSKDLSLKDVAFGAVLAGACWQVLQSLGTFYIASQLKGVSAIGGLFGVVLGLLAWIYLEAVITVICAEINVVAVRRLWPRGLKSMFTDTTDLTDADRAVYQMYAHIERYKTFQQILVNFCPGMDFRPGARRGVAGQDKQPDGDPGPGEDGGQDGPHDGGHTQDGPHDGGHTQDRQ
jgi:membrane protein